MSLLYIESNEKEKIKKIVFFGSRVETVNSLGLVSLRWFIPSWSF